MKQNIGTLNSLCRITAGLTILAWSTAKMVRQPQHESNFTIAILGAMKVGEGILKYCPVTDFYHRCEKLYDLDLQSITSLQEGNPSKEPKE